MPPKYVKTIHEEILYEYAKLISRSAYGNLQRGFITDRFKKLISGEINISGTMREWQREQELPKECVFCGDSDNLTTEHIIPKSRGGTDDSENVVLSCQKCNTSRNNKGIYEWLGLKGKDKLHRLIAGKYLKQLLILHKQKGTLEITREEIYKLCNKCSLPQLCEELGKTQVLTCFCLESVF